MGETVTAITRLNYFHNHFSFEFIESFLSYLVFLFESVNMKKSIQPISTLTSFLFFCLSASSSTLSVWFLWFR